MDQRVNVAYLSLKGLSACAIHEDLRVTLGPDAVAYSMVTNYLHDAYYSLSIAEGTSIEVQKGFNNSNRPILSTLEDNPFASMR
jgi:hypothetical protein